MITYLSRLSWALGLGIATIATLSGQTQPGHKQADTLRRTLKVMTSQETRLDQCMPMSINLSMPTTYTAEARPFVPKPLTSLATPVRISPLASITPLPVLYAKSEQLGYVSGSLGLLFNARVAAGLRPINTKTDILDVNLTSFLAHNNQRGEYPALDIRERGVGIGARYKHIGVQTLWTIGGQYDWARQRRFGVVRATNDRTPLQAELDRWDAVRGQYWTANTLRLDAQIASNPDKSRQWHYQIDPHFGFARLGEITEINPGVSLALAHKLTDYGSLNIDLKTEILAYDDASSSPTIDGTNAADHSAYISVSPSWQIDGVGSNWSWGAQLGVGLSATRVEGQEKSPLLLYPKIDAYIGWAKHWRLRAEIDGGILPNSIVDHYRAYPQMYVLNQAEFTRVPLRSKLSLGGLIKPNFSIELFAGYEWLRNVEDYALSANFTDPTSIKIVDGYRRFYRDEKPTHHWHVGGSLAYTIQQAYTISVGACLDDWRIGAANPLLEQSWGIGSMLSGRPKFTLESQVRYRPSDLMEVNIGYRILAGLKYASVVDKEFRPVDEGILSNFNCFTFSANYRPSKQWTITLDGQYAPADEPSLVLGYRLQPLTFNLGFGYTF